MHMTVLMFGPAAEAKKPMKSARMDTMTQMRNGMADLLTYFILARTMPHMMIRRSVPQIRKLSYIPEMPRAEPRKESPLISKRRPTPIYRVTISIDP